jgi:hypothetical protein
MGKNKLTAAAIARFTTLTRFYDYKNVFFFYIIMLLFFTCLNAFKKLNKILKFSSFLKKINFLINQSSTFVRAVLISIRIPIYYIIITTSLIFRKKISLSKLDTTCKKNRERKNI